MIINGDCLEEMRKMPDNSISCIVTDPPYGLSFMGKGWDHAVPGTEYWKECLRITRPGGHLLAMGGTRTVHRLTIAIEDAGYEIRDSLVWIYGSGFPKSHNDLGLEGYGTALKPAHEPIIMAMKKCDGTFKNNAEKWGQAGINVDGCRVESKPRTTHSDGNHKGGGNDLYQSGLKTGYFSEGSKGRWPANVIFDEEAAEMLDEQSGELSGAGNKIGSKRIQHELGFCTSPKRTNNKYDTGGGASRFFYCAKASSRERNEGLEGFWFDNLELVLHNGTSFQLEELWVSEGQSQKTSLGLEVSQEKVISGDLIQNQEDKECCIIWSGNENEGQFPKIIKYTTSTGLKQTIELKTLNCYQHFTTSECIQDVIKMNEGNGISLVENVGLKSILKRIFTKEKTESLLGVKNAAKRMPCLVNVKDELKRKNFHSTVKPLKLMEYLIKLVMPPKDGILLDPFAGSGTTILAAHQLGMKAIGIEKSSEYCEIANARISRFKEEKY